MNMIKIHNTTRAVYKDHHEMYMMFTLHQSLAITSATKLLQSEQYTLFKMHVLDTHAPYQFVVYLFRTALLSTPHHRCKC